MTSLPWWGFMIISGKIYFSCWKERSCLVLSYRTPRSSQSANWIYNSPWIVTETQRQILHFLGLVSHSPNSRHSSPSHFLSRHSVLGGGDTLNWSSGLKNHSPHELVVKAWLHLLQALWPWESCSTFLFLSFLICKTGIRWYLPLRATVCFNEFICFCTALRKFLAHSKYWIHAFLINN